MRASRKFVVLAAVCGLALAATASSASAYQFLGNYGGGPSPVPAGVFGEEMFLQSLPAPDRIALSVQVGPNTIVNTCDAALGGYVAQNATGAQLRANITTHVFSNCDHSPAWGTGTWVLHLNQGSVGPNGNYLAFMDQIKVLITLGGGVFCEFRGQLNIGLTPTGDVNLNTANKTVARVSGSLAPYNGAGTHSNNCPIISPGTATGKVQFASTTNFANNLIVG
jgi:hypothetical protein